MSNPNEALGNNAALTCADFDGLLCDYADGALASPRRALAENHLAACPSCSELAREAQAVTAFLKTADPLSAPPELVDRILNQTVGQARPGKAPAPKAARRGFSGWLAGIFEPVLQPRLAMGMAMTILSFSMIGRFAGIPQKPLTADDLSPARIWASLDEKMHRVYDRAIKYYDNLRVVYEIQNRLQEWTALEEEDARNRRRTEPAQAAPGAAPVQAGPEREKAK